MPDDLPMAFEDWIVFLIRETCALAAIGGFVVTIIIWAFVLGRSS